MSRYFIRQFSVLLFLFIGIIQVSVGQSKQSLQQKKKKLQQEIQYTNKLLKETEKSKSTSLNQLKQLSKKISTRESLIQTIKAEIDLLNDSISIQESKVDSLEQNMKVLKEQYAEMIRNAYKNRSSYNKLMFLFAADNFNQAFKRLRYFQQYARFRQLQAEKIKEEQNVIDKQITLLEAIKKSNEGLFKAELNEQGILSSEKSEKEKVVNKLKGKEKELKQDLVKKQKAAERINQAIERIIAEEIRKAREKAAKKGNSNKGFPMTPEARELGKSFTANKGKLPWPVNEGVIIGKFGPQRHPTLSNVTIQNDYIVISTKKDNVGRASFKGKVTSVIIIQGQGKAVLVNHGEYYTTYSYFKEVYVQAGDEVDTKQSLGVLISDADEASSIMNFGIWKIGGRSKPDKLDPEPWIYKN